MTLIGKPSGGPDRVGGLFPRKEMNPFKNRAGAALTRGSVVAIDISGSAAEINTTDSNAHLPGHGDASDDSIWNTVVDPVAGHTTGAIPTLFGVTVPDSIADNDSGNVVTFGLVDARVVADGTISNIIPGTPLTVTTTNSFNASIGATERVVAFFASPTNSITNSAEIHKVMLHNGIGFASGELNITVA
jgi:hypothetical protein